MGEQEESERITRDYKRNRIAYYEAITRIPMLGELPETEEELEKWIEENPDKVDLLDRTVDSISSEFSLHISSEEPQDRE